MVNWVIAPTPLITSPCGQSQTIYSHKRRKEWHLVYQCALLTLCSPSSTIGTALQIRLLAQTIRQCKMSLILLWLWLLSVTIVLWLWHKSSVGNTRGWGLLSPQNVNIALKMTKVDPLFQYLTMYNIYIIALNQRNSPRKERKKKSYAGQDITHTK